MCGWSTNIYCCFTEGQVVIASLDQTRDMEMPVISLLPRIWVGMWIAKRPLAASRIEGGIFFSGLFQFLFFTSFSIQFRHSNRGSQDPKTNSETPSSSFHEFCPFFFFKSYFIGQESYEYVGLVVL